MSLLKAVLVFLGIQFKTAIRHNELRVFTLSLSRNEH